MALQTANGNPPTNSLSMSEVNTELGKSVTAQIALNDADVRGLIGKADGATFMMSELYGASSVTGWLATWVLAYDNRDDFAVKSIKVNSSGDIFGVLNHCTQNANRASSDGREYKQFELFKLNSDGVLQDTNGYLTNPPSYLSNNIKNNNNRSDDLSYYRIVLRGTTDVYLHYLRSEVKMWEGSYYTNRNAFHYVKFNQSNLDREDQDWEHRQVNSGLQYTAFNINYTGVAGATGWDAYGDYSQIMIDKNNKLVTSFPTRQGNAHKQIACRYPFDSNKDQAPEVIEVTAMSSPNTSRFNMQTANPDGRWWIIPYDTSWNWKAARSSASHSSYALWKDSATRSAPGGTYGAANISNTTANHSITWLNNNARVRYMVADGNNLPAVCGFGGAKSHSGVIHDGAIWVQKHNSSGQKTTRFSFTGNNCLSASGANGKFKYCVFDSSDNCYLAGASTITRNVDGIWGGRGNYSYNYPQINWIAKFNSSGVYQWHRWFDTKEYVEHYQNGGTTSQFASTYGTSAQYYGVQIQELAIADDGDLLVCGNSPYFGGSTSGTWRSAFVMKLPADGNIANGFVGQTATINSGTRNVGVMIGEFSGTNNTAGAQFFACDHGHVSSFENDGDELNLAGGYVPQITRNNPRSNHNSGSSSNTTSIPCTVYPSQSGATAFAIGRSGNNNERLTAYTAPSNGQYGSGKTEF